MQNITMPQAQFFFTYILWRNTEPTPLQCHIAFGFDRASLEETRRLVQRGAEIVQLLYLGPVCGLEPHHHRKLQSLLRPELPDCPGNDLTLFPKDARVAK